MITTTGNSTIEREFCATLYELSRRCREYPNFSGVGILLHNPELFKKSWYTDLRPSVRCPNISLGDHKAIDILIEISDRTHTLHDGFHFFDCNTGKMTNAAQYFFPPILPGFEVNEDYGTRYHSALFGSCIEGVILTGTINKHKPFIFQRGRILNGRRSDQYDIPSSK